ncbi:MAG: hypothetical protein LBB22_04955 [Treponema sp.]|nr:hypothetical protein [Treponema sp.]
MLFLRKNLNWIPFCLIIILTACDTAVDSEEDEASKDGGSAGEKTYPPLSGRLTYETSTEEGRRFSQIFGKQLEALDNILSTINLYYDDDYIESLVKDGEPLLLQDFSEYFDAAKTREFQGVDGVTYETTLGDEISAVAQDFLGEFEKLKPDLTAFTQIDGAFIKDGIMRLPNSDIIIDTGTTLGILELEIEKAKRANEDIETLVADINAVTGDFFEKSAYTDKPIDETSETEKAAGGAQKAIYKTFDLQYDFGIIPYSFDDLRYHAIEDKSIESEHKAALLDAMRDWENSIAAIGGSIVFVDKTDDIIYEALALVCLAKLRAMYTEDIDSNGYANTGSGIGVARLAIKSGLRDMELYRTTRHELGHTLGLYHEHQRWDRDEYVDVSADPRYTKDMMDGGINYGKIDEYFTIKWPEIRVKMVGVRTGPFKIYLPVFYIEWVDINLFKLADGCGDFDYDSIMLYGGKNNNGRYTKMKKQHEGYYYNWDAANKTFVSFQRTYRVGDEAPYNIIISENDARTVAKNFNEWFILNRLW